MYGHNDFLGDVFAAAEYVETMPATEEADPTQATAPVAEVVATEVHAVAQEAQNGGGGGAPAAAAAGGGGGGERKGPSAEEMAAAARSIIPGARHWDIKSKDWPKEMAKPSSGVLKAELEARVGKETYGRTNKKIANMLVPDLCKALHETPANGTGGGATGGGGGRLRLAHRPRAAAAPRARHARGRGGRAAQPRARRAADERGDRAASRARAGAQRDVQPAARHRRLARAALVVRCADARARERRR